MMARLASLLRPLCLGALLSVSPGFVTDVHAQTSAQDRAAADALFDSGVELMEAGDYDAACVKFQKSNAIDPGVGTLLNLGRCYEKAGRFTSAWTTYREASAKARALGQTAREEHARTEAKNLEARLTRIRIKVAEGWTDVPGFQLSQDGKEVNHDVVIDEAIPVDAGTHQITAVADGYLPRTFEVDATEEGKTYDVMVGGLSADPNATGAASAEQSTTQQAPAESAPAQEPAAQEPAAQKRSIAGPVILGVVGLAAVGTGTAFALMAKSADDDARAICSNVDASDRCTDDDLRTWNDKLDSAESSATVAYIGWGVGGAALVGSAIWLAANLSSGGGGGVQDTASNVRNVEVAPLLGPGTWGLGARGSF